MSATIENFRHDFSTITATNRNHLTIDNWPTFVKTFPFLSYIYHHPKHNLIYKASLINKL